MLRSAAPAPLHPAGELHGYRASGPVIGGPGVPPVGRRRDARRAHQPPRTRGRPCPHPRAASRGAARRQDRAPRGARGAGAACRLHLQGHLDGGDRSAAGGARGGGTVCRCVSEPQTRAHDRAAVRRRNGVPRGRLHRLLHRGADCRGDAAHRVASQGQLASNINCLSTKPAPPWAFCYPAHPFFGCRLRDKRRGPPPLNRPIRNIAIIAHVDHGKTTLVDCLLQQSGTFAAHERVTERVMDSNDIERERGITILAKNCAIEYGGTRINIVDTPGHADFGGEVERVLSMVDGVLLLVDAVEGPMPQTRFVTRKALAQGLKAIVVVNKIDRPGSRPAWVVDQTFDLFDKLGASDAQLDFPVIYTSALQGWASTDYTERRPDMSALFEAILTHVPPPAAEAELPLQMQISTLDYNSYVGRIGIGRIRRGIVRAGQTVALRYGDEDRGTAKIGQVLSFTCLERLPVEAAGAGDIVAVTGIEAVNIGLTVCDAEHPLGLPPIFVDEPTLQMNFQVNTSPLAGREGKFVTSRQLRERLYRELQSNVALRVEDTDEPDVLRVCGRGELHLTILIENMRREGYELAVSRP